MSEKQRPPITGQTISTEESETSASPIAPAKNTLADVTGKELLRDRTDGGFLSRIFSGWLVRKQLDSNAAIDRAQGRAAEARESALNAGSNLAHATERAHVANARLRHVQENLEALQDRTKLQYDVEHEEEVAELRARLAKARHRQARAADEERVIKREFDAELKVRQHEAKAKVEGTKPQPKEGKQNRLRRFKEQEDKIYEEAEQMVREASTEEARSRIRALRDTEVQRLRDEFLASEE